MPSSSSHTLRTPVRGTQTGCVEFAPLIQDPLLEARAQRLGCSLSTVERHLRAEHRTQRTGVRRGVGSR